MDLFWSNNYRNWWHLYLGLTRFFQLFWHLEYIVTWRGGLILVISLSPAQLICSSVVVLQLQKEGWNFKKKDYFQGILPRVPRITKRCS